jgi:hypothetical protein
MSKPKKNWLQRALGRGSKPRVGAVIDTLPWDDLEALIGVDGLLFVRQTLVGRSEVIAPEFTAYARQIFRANPIVFACVARRMGLFSQASFKWRARRGGMPGKLFGTNALAPLEKPWPGASTSDLLALAELYVSIGGNFFATRRAQNRIRVMRPDWVGIVLGSESDKDVVAGDLDAEVIGYMYANGGPYSGKEPIALLPENVCHYMPMPDPEAPWRGMSWMSAIVEDVRADKQATTHKLKYWEGGANPNMIVKPDIEDPAEWDAWVARFRSEHEGVANRYKTLFLAMGVDAQVVGSNLQEADFSKVQGAGEVRICADAQVPPSIAGVSEGLQGSALNAGNFEASWRQFANGWARPAWKQISGALERIVDVPDKSQLWYDDHDIPALQEDVKKIAETMREQAGALRSLVDGGWTPESDVAALMSEDLSLLEHTGKTSVQLYPGGEASPNGTPKELAPAP